MRYKHLPAQFSEKAIWYDSDTYQFRQPINKRKFSLTDQSWKYLASQWQLDHEEKMINISSHYEIATVNKRVLEFGTVI